MTGWHEQVDLALAERTALRRLYLGSAMLIAGTALSVFGVITLGTRLVASLGVPVDRALKIAVVGAGLAVPFLFGALLWRVPSRRHHRLIGTGGVALALSGVATFWAGIPPAWLGGPVAPLLPVAALYGAGLLAAVVAPVLAATDVVTAGPALDPVWDDPD